MSERDFCLTLVLRMFCFSVNHQPSITLYHKEVYCWSTFCCCNNSQRRRVGIPSNAGEKLAFSPQVCWRQKCSHLSSACASLRTAVRFRRSSPYFHSLTSGSVCSWTYFNSQTVCNNTAGGLLMPRCSSVWIKKKAQTPQRCSCGVPQRNVLCQSCVTLHWLL